MIDKKYLCPKGERMCNLDKKKYQNFNSVNMIKAQGGLKLIACVSQARKFEI